MKKEQKLAILAKLEEMYPEAKAELAFSNPYEMLVATMLSAQCTDKQVNKVTPAVFSRWPDANAMAEAETEELFPLVKSCGFKSKAGNIISACRIIKEQHGGKVPDTMEALTALPGVGRKTANVVLSNAFGIPAFAPYSGSEFDLIGNEWIRLTDPVYKEKKPAEKGSPAAKKKKESAYRELRDAVKALDLYTQGLEGCANQELKRLADRIRELISGQD